MMKPLFFYSDVVEYCELAGTLTYFESLSVDRGAR
jgi:hypothetical protein